MRAEERAEISMLKKEKMNLLKLIDKKNEEKVSLQTEVKEQYSDQLPESLPPPTLRGDPRPWASSSAWNDILSPYLPRAHATSSHSALTQCGPKCQQSSAP